MANITVPIQVNLPDDWIEQIVNRLRNDPESEWVEIVRCEDCKHRYEDECPMRHVEWVEYDDDGYIDHDDVVYDYTEDDGYCNKGKRKGADE